MTKSEKIMLFVTIVSISVSILAWLFPVGGNTIILPKYNTLDLKKYSQVNGDYSPARNRKLNEEKDNYVPEITEISFAAFYNQIELSTLDTGKLDYIYENKQLLKNKIKFSELTSVISTMSLDTSQLKAVKLLRGQTELPTENELEIYASYFSLATNKRKALELIYKK